MGLRRALLVLLIANAVAASPALPQLLGDRVEANCSFVASGSVDNGGADNATVAVICGLPPEEVAGLVKLAASPSAGDRAVLYAQLHAIVPPDSLFPVEAVARFLEILHEQPIDDAKLADRFARIAREHVRLVPEIRALPAADPEVQALRDAAAVALQGAPDHDQARAELEEARNLVRAKRAARIAASMPADQAHEEAALVRAQARVETARLRFAAAARLHEEAARLLPAEDRAGSAADWESAGLRWTDQGRGFGDDPALVNAIAAFQAALEEQTRSQAPLHWARTQLNLANAFYFLGEREPRTGRLEAAVVAYRLALQETTRERMPLDWASTQVKLASVLVMLGERGSGTGRLEEAVAAYRLALQEMTRERMPFDWARARGGLATAFMLLGAREVGTARLEAAVTDYRLALEEMTRARAPLDWGELQMNLGGTLVALAERETGTGRLEEAVSAFELA